LPQRFIYTGFLSNRSLSKMTITATTSPQAPGPKKHLPAVGIIGLVLIAAAFGSVYYTQFLVSHSTACLVVPEHRLYLMQAIIHERGGFTVQGIYKLNSTAAPLPPFSNVTGPRITSQNATQLAPLPDPSLVFGSVGDTITLYIHPVSTNESSVQVSGLRGHGFDTDSKTFISITNSTIPNSTQINFGGWYTLSFQITGQGTTKYRCTQTCSNEHPQMNGDLRAGCGG
jgi:hypothetical protein